MQFWTGLALRWPRTLIGVTVVVSVAAGLALVRPGLETDSSPLLLAHDHPARVVYRQMQRDFTGTRQTVLVHLRHSETVFNPRTLARVRALSEALEGIALPTGADAAALRSRLGELSPPLRGEVSAILAGGLTGEDVDPLLFLLDRPGGLPAWLDERVQTVLLKLEPVREVTSLASVENILGRGDELVVGRIYDEAPQTPGGLQRVRREVMGNALYRGRLVSGDERSTAINVETWVPSDRSDVLYDLVQQIRGVLEAHPGEAESWIAGLPVAAATMVNILQRDMARFFPVVFVLVMGTLALTFRTWTGVVLPFWVVLVSILWTMAAMALTGVPLNNITDSLPVFLITIGVADGIHVISEFQDNLGRLGNRAEAVRLTMRRMSLPVILTSVTTTAGFLSLSVTEIQNIRYFGWFVALGVVVAMAVSLTFLPAALLLAGSHPARRPFAPRPALGRRIDAAAIALLEWVSDRAVRGRAAVIVVAAALAAAAVYGATQVRVENDFLSYFRPEAPIVQGTRSINAHLGGSHLMNVLVSAEGDGEPFKDPERLAHVAELQRRLEQLPHVGRTLSLVDLVERLNYVLHDNDPAYRRLPRATEEVGGRAMAGRRMVAQYLLLYENSGGETLSDFTDFNYRTLNVSVRMTANGSGEIARALEAARGYAREHFPEGMSLRFTGPEMINYATNAEVVRSQVTSLMLSLGTVLVMLLLLFRSGSRSLLGTLPLAFTVLLNFGVMGLFGVPLNVGTAIVSGIVIGIGVDYAIHYLTRLQHELDGGLAPEAAFRHTMTASGKAITANALTVSLGFLALTLSDFTPVRQGGWMTSQTLLVSAAVTLVLIPAVTTWLQPRFLRQRGRGFTTRGAAGMFAERQRGGRG